MSMSNDIMGSITVAPHNKMSGKVRIIGYGENDLNSNIVTKYNNSIESNMMIYSDNIIDGNGKYGKQIKTHIEIPHNNNLISSISIMPHNRMKIVAEIIEPPKTQTYIKNIEDSLIIKSSPTLNYSKSSNTFIGKNYEDEFRTLIKININEIPTVNQIITKSELVVQKENYTNSIGKIELYEVLESWNESGVTWKNQPKIGQIVTSVILPINPGTIRINILEKVREWYKGLSVNHGFMMKVSTTSGNDIVSLLENENLNDDIYQFGTSKSEINSPFADIEYYDESLTYSSDVYRLPSAVTVRQNRDSELRSSIFINSYWDKNELFGSITVPQYNEVENLPSRIEVRKSFEGSIPSNIFVSKPQLTGSINVFLSKSLLSNITIRKSINEDLVSTIIARKTSNDDLLSSLIIESKNMNEELNSSIFISKPDLPSVIQVKVFDNLTSSINVRKSIDKELISSLFVSRPELLGSLRVNVYGDLTSSISVRQVLTNKLTSSLFVNRPDMFSNLIVHPTDSLPSSIIVVNDYLKSSLIVRRDSEGSLESYITVRTLKVDELTSQLRVFKGSDLTGSIVIINDNGESYVFIM